ncbi:3-oxoacyl-ACP synthase [Psychroserpens burtonensis]|uniref:3-oxoacyl-ACP synthase n=1 Tax=Psychroserpens burtonensis TaxID=49278 RepID=A0A5C7BG77_9FLAO|nr:3-oxoacyl-ACP synthase [Psychroserpens burtonensis]
MNNIKENLYNECQSFIDNRFETIQHMIKDIQESLTSETKSSAGDKHETGRAMLQLEREKAGQQLAEIQKVNQLLSKIDVSKSTKIIGLGSIAYTTQANYFVAVSAGEFIVAHEKFYAISANTPIGRLLLGKTTGDKVQFRDQNFEIITII